MNYKLVDDIRRVVDQYKDHEVSITTDGIDVYVARMANRQAIEVAKVLLAEIDRLQQERDEARRKAEEAWNENDAIERANHKLIEGLRWYADEQNYDGSEFRLSETEKDEGQRARDILHEIGVTVE